MKTIVNIDTISEYNALVNQPTLHPLVSVIDFSRVQPGQRASAQALNLGFYIVFLKEDKQHCAIRYGRSSYDYQEGTLVFISPNQVVSIEEDGDDYKPGGHALLFHPDLLRGTSLSHSMNEYGFFSYMVHEALHLAGEEKQLVLECFRKIDYELRRGIDKHSKKLIVANIELFLNYCVRFYDRQFITRDGANTGVVEKFDSLLQTYFGSDKPQTDGIPSVGYIAEQLHLSAGYLGDLIKKETGKTALEYIQLTLLEVAKERMFTPTKSISEVAYELGFKYPQHFTRFFKHRVGLTPQEYRSSMN